MSDRRARGAVLLALALVLGGCSPAWRDARQFLADLAAPVATDAGTARERVDYAVDERSYMGDIYRPGGVPQAGVVLVPGVAEQGRDDPRLIGFAHALARTGFLVLVPEIGNLRGFRIRPEDAQVVADAFSHLRSRPELPADRRGGVVAFSYAAGPAVLAAMRPELRDGVDFVVAIGGYFDLPLALAYFTTGHVREDGGWSYRPPSRYGKWVFVLGNLDRLSFPEDRRLLAWVARDRLANGGQVPAGLEQGLGEEGRAILALLTNTDPDAVPGLIASLPPAMRGDLDSLDLASKDLSQLRSHLILVHGIDDDLIPSEQSVAFAAALPRGQAELYRVDGLSHVDLVPENLDRWQLLRAIHALMLQRQPRRPP
ncbi:MAG: alpha/beta hydrolase [Pseudomonadota bacterium]